MEEQLVLAGFVAMVFAAIAAFAKVHAPEEFRALWADLKTDVKSALTFK